VQLDDAAGVENGQGKESIVGCGAVCGVRLGCGGIVLVLILDGEHSHRAWCGRALDRLEKLVMRCRSE
jgi:hypothetical protein